jgi:hypothetical protein
MITRVWIAVYKDGHPYLPSIGYTRLQTEANLAIDLYTFGSEIHARAKKDYRMRRAKLEVEG